MLKKNIFNIQKIISTILIILTLANLIILFSNNQVEAGYSSSFSKYPGYEKLIKELQAAHPNWEFEILETGLDWSEVIIAESTGKHGINVVPISKGDSWKCTCNKTVENVWKCASTAAVAYYMDPRNSLNENYIFQFEQLTYDSKIQTKEGVETILKACDYAQGKITYYDTKGVKQTLNKTYVDVIMEAAQQYNISPYHLASRIRQEQGTGSAGSMISGTWSGENGAYKGYYNFFNIGAYGDDVILEGLKHAKSKGWTDPEKAIKAGAELIVKDYIAGGQDTLYLEKFDVIDGGDGYYVWQYMTNLSASKTEGYTIKNTYNEMGLLSSDSKIKFKIPVYNNMPEQISPEPGTETPVVQDVKINDTGVNVRAGKGTNYDVITTLSKNDVVLRIELDNSKTGGYYWDKVVLSTGKIGYIARNYLTQLNLQSNCNEKYITTSYANIRNGPGTSKTTVLKILSSGQIITVVEKDKYNSINGENWYRVQLSDGTYGYIAASNLETYDTTKIDQLKIICTDGLFVRKSPESGSNILATLAKGAIVTRLEKNVESKSTNYVWNKVVTSGGVIGYMASEDLKNKEVWVEVIKNENADTNTTVEIKGTGYKTSGNNIVCQPNITVKNLKTSSSNIVVKNGNNTIADGANVGTGYKLTLNNQTYTIVVLGDVNGDGKISSADYVRIKNMILKKVELTAEQKLAADANSDSKISSADYVRVKNYILKKADITI